MATYWKRVIDDLKYTPKIKKATDYDSLQSAVNSLSVGETLNVNQDYKLNSTLTITKGGIKLTGQGVITSTSNPVVSVNNTTNPYMNDIVIEGIKVINPNSWGMGKGVGIQISDTGQGDIWHLVLRDVEVQNFDIGISIQNAFDVVLENLDVSQCDVGLKLYSDGGKMGGQVKVFGGMFLNNNTHISIGNFGEISLFGFSCGSSRQGSTQKAKGIDMWYASKGVFSYGGHYEDLMYGFYLEPRIFVNTGVWVGNTFESLDTGINLSNGSANTITLMGNALYSSNALFLPPNEGYLNQGLALIGNTLGNSVYPQKIGVQEIISSIAHSGLKIPAYPTSERPTAYTVPPGFTIFNTDTKRLNISDGSVWYHPDGTTA